MTLRRVAGDRNSYDFRPSGKLGRDSVRFSISHELHHCLRSDAVAELNRGQVAAWVESHTNWRSPATRRNVIAILLAAFNMAEREHAFAIR